MFSNKFKLTHILVLALSIIALSARAEAVVTSTNGTAVVCSPCTFTGITCGGTNTYVVGFTLNSVTPTSVSAAVGSTMTAVLSDTSSMSRNIYMYTLYGGGGDITVAVSALNTDSRFVIGCYPSLNSMGQPEVTGHAEAAGGGGGTSLSKSIVTVTDNDYMIGTGFCFGGIDSGVAGTTERDNSATVVALLDSNGTKSPAGSYGLGFNFASAGCGSVIFVGAYAPTGGGGGATLVSGMTLFGAGK